MNHKYTVIINLHWCRGHKWSGNNMADKLAKKSVFDIIIKRGEIHNTNKTTPISMKSIKKIINNCVRSKVNVNIDEPIHVISNNIYKWNIFTKFNQKYLNSDLMSLSKPHYTILSQLRMEA